jgi:hypothetical protein
MAAGKPLASYMNPINTGARSYNRTGPTGGTHEQVARSTLVRTYLTNGSLPGAGRLMNFRYRPDSQGSELLRPWSRSVFINSVVRKAAAIVAAAKHQEIQQL